MRTLTRTQKALHSVYAIFACMCAVTRQLHKYFYPHHQRLLIPSEERRKAFNHLGDRSLEGLTDVTTFVLSEIKAGVKLKNDNIRALETMAISQIAVASTLIAIFGAFDRHLVSPWLSGLAFLALAVCISGLALWPRMDRFPSPEIFSFGPTLREASNKEKIAAMLGEAWVDYSLELERVGQKKSRPIVGAWLLIFLGVTLLSIGLLK